MKGDWSSVRRAMEHWFDLIEHRKANFRIPPPVVESFIANEAMATRMQKMSKPKKPAPYSQVSRGGQAGSRKSKQSSKKELSTFQSRVKASYVSDAGNSNKYKPSKRNRDDRDKPTPKRDNKPKRDGKPYYGKSKRDNRSRR